MKQCLVVDDSKVIRRVARRILEELNFAISEEVKNLTNLKAASSFSGFSSNFLAIAIVTMTPESQSLFDPFPPGMPGKLKKPTLSKGQ